MNSPNRTIDWLLAGCPTLAVTIVIALLLGQNLPKSLAIGLATSATSLASAAILNGRQMTRLVLLEQQITERNQAEQLRAELPNLQAQYNKLSADNEKIHLLIEDKIRELEAKQEMLGRSKAQLAELNERRQQIKEAIAPLVEQQQAIERRISALQKNYPDLERLEKLQSIIAELELRKIQLEAEIKAVQDKFASMADLQVSLHTIEAKILDKRLEYEKAITKIQQLETQTKKQDAENEALKAKGDRLREEVIIHQAKLNKVEQKTDPLEALKHPLWPENSDSNLPLNSQDIVSEAQFLRNFIQNVQAQGFYFPDRLINAFHTSLKVQRISALAVLSGISGTGKSKLPQLYAKYIGAQFLMLAVQPRWDSPQDLLGFYNYMENKFKPTPLIQGIYQYNRSPELQDKIVLVLLDEMNLARVEYYFSEFLSKLESRGDRQANLELDLGNLSGSIKRSNFQIPDCFLFVGTMNEDETTQTLSDKVLDRANVITFGQPPKLELGNSQKALPDSGLSGYLSYRQFHSWIKQPANDSPAVKRVEKLLNKTNHIMGELGHPFAHRVYQSIVSYIVNYPGVDDIKSEAFTWAVADQFGQKILPKLRGLAIEDELIQDKLDQLGEIVKAIGDANLTAAFERSRQGYQFQWKGLAYKE